MKNSSDYKDQWTWIDEAVHVALWALMAGLVAWGLMV